jgi:hypothetical protein
MKKLILLFFISIFISSCTNNISPKIENIIDTVAPVPTKILESGLPDIHLIKTAFVPQAPEKNWDQPWQDACEEASILTVHYYYQNKSADLSDLLTDYQALFSTSKIHDINQSQMANVANKLYGYKSEIINNPTIDQIKTYLAKDTPVIITANGKTLFKENKRFKNGGPWYHSLIILGYDDNRQQFTVHDVGTQFGAYFKYSYSLLMDSIHDFPESGKKEEINSGSKRILVLLK